MCENCKKFFEDLKSGDGEVEIKEFNSAEMSEEIVSLLFKSAAVKMATDLPKEKVLGALSIALLSVLVTNIRKLDDLNKFELMKVGIEEFYKSTIDLLERERDDFEAFIARCEATSSSKH